ncbi:universal stress protein [Yeosuana marina]|uniref:universal stress protein n=1 Tax=Yeosuana marina TaxID=1565536 RepID=UPI0030EB77EB|tara:strand:+ start:5112 stop:5963 length:852 start_codon:yes stop_codon:yes gene_type:complete
MKKILLPTDFSKNSWNAIKYALQLFKNETFKMYLLNTWTPTIYQVEYLLGNPAEFNIPDPVMESSLKQLKTMENRLKKDYPNPKHTIETMSVFNNLIPEIKEVVEAKNIDYVVMGTKGATGAKEVLFGSHTVHVFKSIKCPVLAIPEDFKFETPHEILFPTDFEVDYNTEFLRPLLEITSMYISRINVLNVSFGYDLTEEQLTNKQKLEKFFKNTTYLFHRVTNESIQEAITEFQRKSRINLLVMINNKHSFFENLFFKSTINQIGFHLNIPFLLIPSKGHNI